MLTLKTSTWVVFFSKNNGYWLWFFKYKSKDKHRNQSLHLTILNRWVEINNLQCGNGSIKQYSEENFTNC